jgi:hypothetical protein
MEADRGVASPDAVHERLRRLVAEMMGLEELVPMLNTLFGIHLPEDAVSTPRTAGDLAGIVEDAWYDSGATAKELAERLAVLDDE